MKNPRNLLIFAVLGGVVGLGLGFALGAFTGKTDSAKGAEADIRNMLAAQTAAWNDGDIEGFMQDYVKGDTLRFASGGNIENGWQPTLERYQSRYPDRAAMGKLISENYDVKVIDADDALVFGRWELERASDNPSGLYTLHVRKLNGRWVVVSDHTSSAD